MPVQQIEFRPFLVVGLALALLSTPRMSPAVAAETDRRYEILTWVRLLADREANTRDRARQALLGLRRSDLPLLRDVVTALQPLRPAQIEPLEDIVVYVMTRATLSDLPRAGEAFLGVSLPSELDEEFGLEETDQPASNGVPIVQRLCGFVAYRYLEDGDVIEAIRCSDLTRPTRTIDEFRAAIRSAQIGQDVTFRVRRAAKLMDITFALDAKAAIDQRELEITIQNAQSSASDYWEQTFARLVTPEQL